VLHAVVNQADGLAYAPLPAASGLRPAARPLLHADQMRWAAVRLAATLETEEPSERLPYVLTGLPRSRFRGKAMGWLHKTRSWYVTAALYIALAAVVGRQMGNPLSKTQLAFRACAAAATSANVFISDRYHNPDLRLRAGRPDAYSAEAETWALRCDYVGISSVLTTQLWLWSSNMAWMHQLKLVGVVSGLMTFAVAVLARAVVPRKAGHSAVKVLMGAQFAALLGYLAWTVWATAPVACRVSVIIFFTYMPGLVVYALKWPKSHIFGFHEWFHTSVLFGHSLSMLFDLRDIAMPCARGWCP